MTSYKPLVLHFAKFTTLVHVGTKMNCLDFQVKGHSHSETKYAQISTLGAFFTCF